MRDVIPKIQELDGYLFFDRFDLGEAGLRSKISERYSTLAEAQSWMNIILLDEFISEAVDDKWRSSDSLVDELLSIFAAAWTFQINHRFPDAKIAIDKVVDDESGDVGLRLISMRNDLLEK